MKQIITDPKAKASSSQSKLVLPSFHWREWMDEYLQGKCPEVLTPKLTVSLLSVEGVSKEFSQQAGVAGLKLPLKEITQRWTSWILEQIAPLSILERAAIIETFAAAWQVRRHEATAQQAYLAFKNTLSRPWQDWQNQLLGVRWVPQLRIQQVSQTYHPSLSASLFQDTRASVRAGLHPTQSALIGSSFAAVDVKEAKQASKTTSLLDSGFSATLLDASGRHCSGFVLALGDGNGGHFGDAKQDRAISRAAYFASKQACRLLAACRNAQDVAAQYSALATQVAQTIRRKTHPFQENTTLIALRGFWQPGSDQLEIAGFHVGDSLLVYWHPVSQRLYTLASAMQSEDAHGQQATASIPGGYRQHELHLIRQTVPADGIFLAGSDGAYEMLPMNIERQPDPKWPLGFIRKMTLDDKALQPLLGAFSWDQPVTHLLETLWHEGLARLEVQRQQRYASWLEAKDGYEDALQALKIQEAQAQAALPSAAVKAASEGPPALPPSIEVAALRRKLDHCESTLTQARLGDDCLWIGIAWPRRILQSKLLPLETKEGVCPLFQDEKKSLPSNYAALQALDAKLNGLMQQRQELKAQGDKNKATSGGQAYLKLNQTIKTLQMDKSKISKFPNALAELLLPRVRQEPDDEVERQALQEEEIITAMRALLSRCADAEKNEYLGARNAFGETILMLAIQGKCYHVACFLIDEIIDTEITSHDSQGLNILHHVCGHRLPGRDRDSRARPLCTFLDALRDRQLLGPLLWRPDRFQGNYPIHLAVTKAISTGQTEVVQCLLAYDRPLPGVTARATQLSMLALTNGEGETPLHRALNAALALVKQEGSDFPAITVLLQHSRPYPLHEPNRAGQTPADLLDTLLPYIPREQQQRWLKALQAGDAPYPQEKWLKVSIRDEKFPLPVLPATQLPLQDVQVALHQALVLAKQQAADPAYTQREHLQTLLDLFALPEMKAELISVIDWNLLNNGDQRHLLSCLWGQSFSALTLTGCRVLNETVSYQGKTSRIWQALLTANPQLHTLTLVDCAGLTLEPITAMSLQNRALKWLTLRRLNMEGIYQWRLFQDECISFPALQQLIIQDCPLFNKMMLIAPQLTELQIDNCPQLTQLVLKTPQLLSFGCRGARKLATLDTEQPALLPLAAELKTATQQGLSHYLSIAPGKIPPLYQASQKGRLSVVRWLIDMEVPVNTALDSTQETALHQAAANGHPTVVAYLLRVPNIEVSPRNNKQQTPLFLAVKKGDPEIVQLFCECLHTHFEKLGVSKEKIVGEHSQSLLDAVKTARQHAAGDVRAEQRWIAIDQMLSNVMAQCGVFEEKGGDEKQRAIQHRLPSTPQPLPLALMVLGSSSAPQAGPAELNAVVAASLSPTPTIK